MFRVGRAHEKQRISGTVRADRDLTQRLFLFSSTHTLKSTAQFYDILTVTIVTKYKRHVFNDF